METGDQLKTVVRTQDAAGTRMVAVESLGLAAFQVWEIRGLRVRGPRLGGRASHAEGRKASSVVLSCAVPRPGVGSAGDLIPLGPARSHCAHTPRRPCTARTNSHSAPQ